MAAYALAYALAAFCMFGALDALGGESPGRMVYLSLFWPFTVLSVIFLRLMGG